MTKTVITTTINKEDCQEKNEKSPQVREDDLKNEEGKVEEMIDNIHSKIEKTIGKTKEGLHKFIAGL
jgi:hypothetical protein